MNERAWTLRGGCPADFRELHGTDCARHTVRSVLRFPTRRAAQREADRRNDRLRRSDRDAVWEPIRTEETS